MNVRKIEHVAIAVRDDRPLKDVLEGAFGLSLEYEEEHPGSVLSFYPVGETYLELLRPRVPAPDTPSMAGQWTEARGEGLFHLCLEVDDIRAALGRLGR